MLFKKRLVYTLTTIIIYINISPVTSLDSFKFKFDKTDPIFRAKGGTKANITDWRFIAGFNFVDSSKDSFCVGSLIQKDWLLTTAHCIPDNPKNVKGKIGVYNLNDVGQVVTPKMIIPHPEYHFDEKTGYFNDIALVKLDSEVVLGDVGLVPIGSQPSEVGSECRTASWIPEDSQFHLFQINQRIIDTNQCRDALGENSVLDTNLCTIINSESDHCMGDMGSPLICNGVQIAIISWGLDCVTPGYPIVWTNLTSYLDWIGFTIKEFGSEESYKMDRVAQDLNQVMDVQRNVGLDSEVGNRILNTDRPADVQTKNPTKFPWQRSMNNVAFHMPMRVLDSPKFEMITESHEPRQKRKNSYKSKLKISFSVCLLYFVYLVMYFNYFK